jgi:hypothetical protein
MAGSIIMSRSISFAVACWFAALIATDEIAFAQSGSTGGTIGKTDKSASGSQVETPAHQTGTPGVTTTKGREGATRSVTTSSVGVVAGRWHWIADCNNDRYEAEFVLSDVNNGRFTGNFTGGAGDGTITDGSINGKTVAFTRNFLMWTQRWVGQVSGERIRGSLTGATSCTWEASKL